MDDKAFTVSQGECHICGQQATVATFVTYHGWQLRICTECAERIGKRVPEALA